MPDASAFEHANVCAPPGELKRTGDPDDSAADDRDVVLLPRPAHGGRIRAGARKTPLFALNIPPVVRVVVQRGPLVTKATVAFSAFVP